MGQGWGWEGEGGMNGESSMEVYVGVGVVVESLSHVPLFVKPWTAARQASLSLTISRGLLKLMSFELVMPSNHLICCPLLLLPSLSQNQDLFQLVGSFPLQTPSQVTVSLCTPCHLIKARSVGNTSFIIFNHSQLTEISLYF